LLLLNIVTYAGHILQDDADLLGQISDFILISIFFTGFMVRLNIVTGDNVLLRHLTKLNLLLVIYYVLLWFYGHAYYWHLLINTLIVLK